VPIVSRVPQQIPHEADAFAASRCLA